MQAVVDETIALYQWLAWVADRLYDEGAKGATRRWVLRRLAREGPRTVSALAKIRAVRRQSLQPVVDALVGEGLVSLAPNPRHARARLVALTRRGESLVAALDRVDSAVLRSVARGIDERDLETTARTLQALREAFGTRERWVHAAESARASAAP